MRILALDTMTRAGSVAVLEDATVVRVCHGDPSRTHAERLPGDLLALLAEVGWAIGSLDLLAVGVGPGAFTGLRVGIACIQGIAMVTGRPTVPVSALDAHAAVLAAGHPAGTRVGVLLDAMRGDVFAALYEVDAPHPDGMGTARRVDRAQVGLATQILADWDRAGLRPVVVGGHADAPGAASIPNLTAVDVPLAPVLGRLAIRAAAAGGSTAPHQLAPEYVRRPDAEVARDQRMASR